MGVALVALVLAAAGGAYAAGSASSKTISACQQRHGGVLYVAKHCTRGDRRVRWNITGPTGSQGAQGSAGTAGTPGATGAPATKYFAQIHSDGTVNTSSVPATTDHIGTGVYLVNFGVDVTHCVAYAQEAALPIFSSPGSNTGSTDGYAARVDLTSAGGSYGAGFPSADTVAVSTFGGTTPLDTTFEVAVFC